MTRRHTDPALRERLTLAPDAARRAVDAADLRALLMMVFQHTGDRYWLGERFHPVRDVRLIAPEDAGLPEDVGAEVRAAAAAVLSGTAEPSITDPDDVLLLEMMRIALGEDVPVEYVAMMREQMGLTSPLHGVEPLDSPVPPDLLPVVIVGAGESGIALGAMLNDLGIEYQIVERGTTVGGTWRDNTYPGCAVDTPNHSYSFSFGARYPWSRFFSERHEIQDYLQRCADEFDVRSRVSFGTRCVQADWQEDANRWQILLETDGCRRVVHARFLISAIGPFGDPRLPDVEGLGSFAGPTVHSAQWPSELDVSNKSVAIIGTGASCMQIGPAIAEDVAALTILQRTPPWVRPIPRFHDEVHTDVQVLLQSEPYYSRWYRFVMLWRYGDGLLATLRKDPHWPHPERSVGPANDRHRQQLTAHIHDVLGDRHDLIAKCVPDYPPYGKRILLDNGWYETLLRPNVTLVTESIAAVEPDGIRLADGSFVEVDVLVFATGFDVSRNAARLNVRGRDGLTLDEKWAGGIAAYLGIAVPGFPNFFMTQGPNTGLGHGGSLIFTSETQARYISLAIHHALCTDVVAMEVTHDAYDGYVERLDAEHDQLVWTHPGMLPYYRDAFGKVRTLLPWRLVDYFHMAGRPDFTVFDVVRGVRAVAERA